MYRILSGIVSILAGISATLYGFLPHYYQLEVNRSILANAPPGGGPTPLPAIIAIPPISYPLIALGTILIGLGIFLVITGIGMRRSGKLQNNQVN